MNQKKNIIQSNQQNTKLWQTNIYNIFFSTKWIISVMKSTSITQVSFKRVLWTTPFCNGIPYRLYMNSYEQHQYHTQDMTNQKLTNGPIDCFFRLYFFPRNPSTKIMLLFLRVVRKESWNSTTSLKVWSIDQIRNRLFSTKSHQNFARTIQSFAFYSQATRIFGNYFSIFNWHMYLFKHRTDIFFPPQPNEFLHIGHVTLQDAREWTDVRTERIYWKWNHTIYSIYFNNAMKQITYIINGTSFML